MPHARGGLSRRELCTGVVVGAVLVLTTCVVRPEPATPPGAGTPAARLGRLPRIGYLAYGESANNGIIRLRESFLLGLDDLGYAEGRNVAIEYRYAEGQGDRVAALAAELVALPVDVILAADSNVVPVAREQTATIPIVMALFSDPVGVGLAQSLAHPGGNVTGMSNLNRPLAGKRLELLQELVPGLSRVAVLYNGQHPGVRLQWQEIEEVAPTLGVGLLGLPVRGPDEFAAAFPAATAERAEALVVLPDPLTLSRGRAIVELAAEARLPAIYGVGDLVEAGGLASLAADRFGMMRRAATFVDKILMGASPADLPIEQATRFELVINLRTAQALGLTVPRELLLDAAEVIQ